jgi:LysM domain
MDRIAREAPADHALRAGTTTLVAGVAATTTAWASWWLLSLAPAAAVRPASGPGGPLLAVAAALAALVCGRLCLSALACAGYGFWTFVGPTGCRPARDACARLAVACSPTMLRPVVAVLVAGGITMSTVGTASAVSVVAGAGASRPVISATSDVGTARPQLPDPGWSAPVDHTLTGPDALASPAPTWTPVRPPAAPRRQPDVTVVAAAARRGDDVAPVVVRRGDTLWAIAARYLGPGASDADIAEQWPRWWRVNRAQIGDDPDRLLPGQVLVVPHPGATR